MRNDEELIEVAHLTDGARKIFAAFGIHVNGRLVEESEANVGELLEKREADAQSRYHLFAA